MPIHDYGEIDGQLYLDMCLVEGTDMATLLKRFGSLTPPRVVGHCATWCGRHSIVRQSPITPSININSWHRRRRSP